MTPLIPPPYKHIHDYTLVVTWSVSTSLTEVETKRAVEVMCPCGHIETTKKLKGGDDNT